MNEDHTSELQQEINFLYDEMGYLQTKLMHARTDGETDEYTRFMRIFLPVQKQYLKLCAEQEKREQAENTADPLMEFNA